MTTEKMIEHVAAMLEQYDISTGSRGAASVIADPAKWLQDPAARNYLPQYVAAAELLLALREKLASRATPATVLAACKRMIKNAPSSRPELKGIFPHSGRWCICDGYRLIRLNADLPSLPHTESALDTTQIIPQESICGKPLPLPSVAQVRSWLAEEKGRTGHSWKPGDLPYLLTSNGLQIGVNPCYLLDMLQALPDCDARYSNPISPIYFAAENGDGILLPVRLNKDAAKAKAA